MGYSITTVKGYSLLECASALQKAIRRGDQKLAGYFGLELFMSGYRDYVWKRLFTISAEDCAGIITQEIRALHECWLNVPQPDRKKNKGRIFVSKAILILAGAIKNRDADHLQNLYYDADMAPAEELEALIEEARDQPENIPVPEYAFDVHTSKGRKAGKTKKQFFIEEQDALNVRQPGLFDGLVDDLR